MAEPVQVLPPGADEAAWLAARRHGIGASEISAVLGISPWESPFSLYWRKANGWEIEDAPQLEAGRRAESMIADWFADVADPNENMEVRPAGLYRHAERRWQLATPDRLVSMACAGCDGRGWMPNSGLMGCDTCDGDGLGSPPLAVLECKHPYDWDGFGETGTDEVPVYHRAQVLQQMDVLGVDEGYLAAYTRHEFRWFLIRRDERDLAVMRAAGAAWWRRFEAGDPPDVDSHTATGRVLKQLHPSVEDFDVQVSLELAEGYRRARALRSRIEATVDRYEHRLRAAIGDGRRALYGTKLVASRSVYDQAGDSAELMAIDDEWPTVNRLNPGRAASYVA